MPQPLNLMDGGSGTLLAHRQTRTLLHAYLGGVVLEAEQVLRVPGQQSHSNVEVRALEVRHGLKALLPYGVLLIQRDRQCCNSGEAVLAPGGESDVCHHLNADVGLAADDGSRPWHCRVEGYHHTILFGCWTGRGLATVMAVKRRGASVKGRRTG
jgi:hypothetical protein